MQSKIFLDIILGSKDPKIYLYMEYKNIQKYKMRRITSDKLPYEPNDFTYLLPFEYNQKNDMVEKTLNLLMKDCYIVDRLNIKKEDNHIYASYQYEGWADYHMFELELEIILLEDKNKVLLLGVINQDVHDLFEEIIRYKILPIWSKHMELLDLQIGTNYKYTF